MVQCEAVRWPLHLLAALAAVWVAVLCRSAHAEPRAEGPAYAVLAEATPGRMCPGETQRVEVTLENTGGRTWAPSEQDRLSYHWYAADGSLLVRDGRRTDLGEPVPPGESVELSAKVTAPTSPGAYRLVWRMLREGEGWFPQPEGAAAAVRVDGEGPPLAWSIEAFDVPELAARGETTVRVTLTNEGCATWSPQTADRLSYRWFDTDGTTKRAEGPRTPYEEPVGPGEQTTVDLLVRGPPAAGRYILRVAPVREKVAWLGEPERGGADRVVEVRSAALQWAWVSGTPPAEIATGDVVEVEVEVRNTGTEAWDPALGDRLSYHWRRDGVRLDREGRRTLLPHRVEPGESLRIALSVTAPPEPGPAHLEVEPLRERVVWFGPPSSSAFPEDGLALQIASPPFVWTQLGVRTPKLPMAGRATEFTLVVRNDGTRTWDPALGDRASYEVLSPDGKRVARGRRTALPRRIAPGEVVQLPVSFDTPRAAGEYQIAFGIVREHVRWFDTDAEPVPLTIVRRSSLWLWLALAAFLGWFAALRSRRGWARAVAWPAWTAVSIAVLSDLFADLAQLQIFTKGTPVASSIAAAFGLSVAVLPMRWQPRVAATWVLLFSLVAWVDLAYVAFFGSLAPLTAIAAIHHLVDAKATVGSTIQLDHAWLAVPLLCGLAVRRALRVFPGSSRQRDRVRTVGVLALASVYAVVSLTHVMQSSLGVRIFSEAHNAKRFGYVGAHVFQALRLLRGLGTPPLSDEELQATFAALADIRAAAPSEGHGVAAGANLIVLQVEALQQWAVHATVEGRPVMPFLSGAHAQALAYDHIYDQTLQGRTSDAEYLVLASGHALPEGALSFLRADNDFRTLVHTLESEGYASYSAHPYERGFWNRSVLHPAYGFDDSDFQAELGRGPKSGWGLADGPFLERFDERIATLPEPFVTFGITLSLHHPYASFPRSLAELDVGELQGTWVGNYLQAMHHFDRSLQAWLERLRERGQLQRTVVVIYGDHVTGMDLDDDVAAIADVPDERFTQMRMHRVPVFIWEPSGTLHGQRSMVGGQVDVGVTALHLLGVEPPASAVGTPLLGGGPGFAALPTGGVVGPDRMLVRRGRATPPQGACVDPHEPGGRPRSDCDALERRALEQLELARRVLDHDLYVAAQDAR